MHVACALAPSRPRALTRASLCCVRVCIHMGISLSQHHASPTSSARFYVSMFSHFCAPVLLRFYASTSRYVGACALMRVSLVRIRYRIVCLGTRALVRNPTRLVCACAYRSSYAYYALRNVCANDAYTYHPVRAHVRMCACALVS